MSKITKEMLKIYKPYSELDWLNYKLNKKEVTYHHIIKREHGGKSTIENGALLMPVAHQYLHLIECKEINLYVAINKMFEFINKQRHEPTKEQREIMEYLLNSFEELHKEDKGAKGKLLIKKKYLQREN